MEFNNYFGSRVKAVNAKIVTILLVCSFLVGCENQVLYSNLTESEANEMVSRLYTSSLYAEKVATKDGTFQVQTDQSSFSNAVSVLQSHGLPRERFQSLGDVFEKDGFVSSSLEERARLNYALSQEIAKTISNIDGVIMARVHLAVPKREHLAKTAEPSSASVFVKHRADVDLSASVGKIKSLVVTGFENLPYENVTLSLFPAENRNLGVESEVDVLNASFASRTVPDVLFYFLILITFTLLSFGFYLLFKGKKNESSARRGDE